MGERERVGQRGGRDTEACARSPSGSGSRQRGSEARIVELARDAAGGTGGQAYFPLERPERETGRRHDARAGLAEGVAHGGIVHHAPLDQAVAQLCRARCGQAESPGDARGLRNLVGPQLSTPQARSLPDSISHAMSCTASATSSPSGSGAEYSRSR